MDYIVRDEMRYSIYFILVLILLELNKYYVVNVWLFPWLRPLISYILNIMFGCPEMTSCLLREEDHPPCLLPPPLAPLILAQVLDNYLWITLLGLLFCMEVV